jgi:hypothetical protein
MGYPSKNSSMPEVIGDRLSEIVPSRSSFVGYHTRKPPMPKMFRKSAIGDIISFFVSAYSFSRSSMPKGSVIDDILGDACREINLASADADEDRDSTTLVLSSIFFHA